MLKCTLAVCATVWVYFTVAPSLPGAILWCLNLCIISHSASCPRSSMTPATSLSLRHTSRTITQADKQDHTAKHDCCRQQQQIWLRCLHLDFRLFLIFSWLSFFFFPQRVMKYQNITNYDITLLFFLFFNLDCSFQKPEVAWFLLRWTKCAEHQNLQWLNHPRISCLNCFCFYILSRHYHPSDVLFFISISLGLRANYQNSIRDLCVWKSWYSNFFLIAKGKRNGETVM